MLFHGVLGRFSAGDSDVKVEACLDPFANNTVPAAGLGPAARYAGKGFPALPLDKGEDAAHWQAVEAAFQDFTAHQGRFPAALRQASAPDT